MNEYLEVARLKVFDAVEVNKRSDALVFQFQRENGQWSEEFNCEVVQRFPSTPVLLNISNNQINTITTKYSTLTNDQ